MYGYNLKIKNVLPLTLAIFLFNFILIKNVNAIGETTSGKSDSYVSINTPSEDIKKIPIIGYKLIYKTYSSSLADFLEKEIEKFKNNLLLIGVKEKNIVIIFLDYYGYSSSKFDYETQNTNKDASKNSNKSTSYTTDEGIALDLSKMRQNYSIPFIATKRNVLIGTLVDNSNAFNGNKDLSVTKFNIPDAQGFQYFSRKSYTKDAKKNNDPFQDKLKEKKSKSDYTKEELIEQRANMIQYMNLARFKKTNFVGMMEYHDLTNDIYAYFAIPGKLNDFLYPKDNQNYR